MVSRRRGDRVVGILYNCGHYCYRLAWQERGDVGSDVEQFAQLIRIGTSEVPVYIMCGSLTFTQIQSTSLPLSLSFSSLLLMMTSTHSQHADLHRHQQTSAPNNWLATTKPQKCHVAGNCCQRAQHLITTMPTPQDACRTWYTSLHIINAVPF